jgi:diguanylate cyclase (GGDEF)-like protein
MRIRSIIIVTFLFATLVPSVFFGLWTYQKGVEREFGEVKDRHLLLAQNLGRALDHYQIELVASFETISGSMLSGMAVPNLRALMKRLEIESVVIADRKSGRVLSEENFDQIAILAHIPANMMKNFRLKAFQGWTTFTTVMKSPDGVNVIYGLRRYQDKIAIAKIRTNYFIELGKSIAFGKKGHAAIVDQAGNVLAHPFPDWIAARKNISGVSIVQRMMNGETGIQQFYSPALKGDLIAGFSTVKRAGWGVMIPQPVSEIYDKVYENNKSILAAIGIGLSMTLVLAIILVRSLVTPLEQLALVMKSNSESRKLATAEKITGILSVRELTDLRKNYNAMVQRVSESNKKIELLAYNDTVTGLPNREKFQQVVCDILAKDENENIGGTLVLIDLDDFKEINDTHGHDVGDEFLRACASKLLLVAEKASPLIADNTPVSAIGNPSVARIGGDEFTILIPGLTDEAEINVFLDTLRKELSEPAEHMVYISECSASIGCARFPIDGTTFDKLLKRADIAMYHAKKDGKNKACIYRSQIGSLTATEVRRDVLIAIANDELFLEYQPKICTKLKSVAGVEALVRWNHPALGRLPPDLWIPAIVNSPVIGKLGEWVTNQAMKDHKTWFAAGHDIKLSINIGSKHFIAPTFISSLDEAAKRNNFDSANLTIEITEDAIFSSEERAEAVLNQLHDLNFSISIDDFGKGYSNIARLAKLPVDIIKIDQSLVTGALENARTEKMLASTISMAKSLGSKTVAEGVETLDQAEFVTQMGADFIQGYYFARSMNLLDLLNWLESPKNQQVLEYQKALKIAFG